MSNDKLFTYIEQAKGNEVIQNCKELTVVQKYEPKLYRAVCNIF